MLLFGVIGMIALRSPDAAFPAVASDIFTNFASYTPCCADIRTYGLLASYSGIGKVCLMLPINLSVIDRRYCFLCSGKCNFRCYLWVYHYHGYYDLLFALPEMEKRNYKASLSGIYCCGSSLAVLIPPSATMIIYGVTAEESIGRLFMADLFLVYC